MTDITHNVWISLMLYNVIKMEVLIKQSVKKIFRKTTAKNKEGILNRMLNN